MNLIRNTLTVIVILQLLLFLSFKLFYKEKEAPSIKLTRTIILPKSNAYTSYPNDTQPIVKNITPQKTVPSKMVVATLLHKEFAPQKKIIKQKRVNKPIEVQTLNKKVEAYAKKLLGYKYVWGATGPKSFDCSGFTQKVYRKTAGINIPRVSREQAKVGKYIEYAKLKKGDMVFFDTEKKYTKRVNHVGIYLGDHKFIHASSAKKQVIITSFKRKPFYKKRFLWGRRVLKDSSQINIATLLMPKSSQL